MHLLCWRILLCKTSSGLNILKVILILTDHINTNFRAPELFEVPSNCEIDERSDVWSLGCTLYAMAYGKFVLLINYNISVIRLLQFLVLDHLNMITRAQDMTTIWSQFLHTLEAQYTRGCKFVHSTVQDCINITTQITNTVCGKNCRNRS